MRVGFIGCGKISHHYAKALESIGGKVTAVSARSNSERLQNFKNMFPEVKAYFSWEEMVQDSELDALILCASWNKIEKLAIDIIKTKKPVLIEKPVALSATKAELIIQEVGDLKNQVMVGYNRRFFEGIHYLKRKLQTGKLLSADFEIPDAAETIINQKGEEIKEFIPHYMTSHWIDLIHYTLGEITKKEGSNITDSKNTFKGHYGLYHCEEHNCPLTIRINYDAPANISFKYIFEDETLHFLPIEHLICSDKIEKTQDENGNNIYRPRKKYEIVEEMEFKPGFLSMLTEFKECFVDKKSQSKIASKLEDIIWINKFIEENLRH
jgi:uncharacterized protein involved in tolerance to divalent cations